MRKVLLIVVVVICIAGCTSESQRKLDEIQKEIQTLQTQNANWEGQKTRYEDIQARLTQLSSASDSDTRVKADSLLVVVKERLARVYEEIDYKQLNEVEGQLASATSYDEAIQQHQDLLIRFSNFEKKYPSSSKPIADGKQRINSSLEAMYNEKFEYVQLSSRFKNSYTFEEASAGLTEIDSFRQKHPNSIMGSYLNQAADGMREVKAKLWARDISSIPSLNTAVQEVNKLKEESYSSGTQNFIQSVADSLEAKRSEIFQMEVGGIL